MLYFVYDYCLDEWNSYDYIPKHTGPTIAPEHFLNNFVSHHQLKVFLNILYIIRRPHKILMFYMKGRQKQIFNYLIFISNTLSIILTYTPVTQFLMGPLPFTRSFRKQYYLLIAISLLRTQHYSHCSIACCVCWGGDGFVKLGLSGEWRNV